jgi:hypothetical protein
METKMSEIVPADSAWNGFLGAIAAGTPLADACVQFRVTRTEIDVATLNPLEAQRWAEACLAAKRGRWPQLHLDEIFSRIAAGKEVEQALVDVRGVSEDAGEFYELMDLPALADRYASAQRAKALRRAESLTAIADDDSKDTLDTLKGPIPNMAAVTRAKLRIETRQALNAAWHPDRFSEKKNNVQVNVQVNYAETLEAARTRAKIRDKAPARITQRVVDAAFSEVPTATPEPAAVLKSTEAFGLDD